MDPLGTLLDAPRAREAFLLRVTMAPPWSLLIEDEAALTVVAFLTGSAWFTAAGAKPEIVGPGDVLLLRRDGYQIGDAPGREPTAVIRPGNRAQSRTGESLDLPFSRGVRTWGNAPDGPDTMLVGNYASVGEVGGRLLAALPDTIRLTRERWRSPLVELIVAEARRDALGQASLLDRLLDALVVSAIQHWSETAVDESPTWLRVGFDDAVRQAISIIHAEPAAPWSVPELARAVGLSRSAFARRFAAAVGESPMAYLTGLRLAAAADRLRGTSDPIATIARGVGYDSQFTFSTAFKRRYGVGPLAYRRSRTG